MARDSHNGWPERGHNRGCPVKKLLLSAFSIFSLIYPQWLYGADNQPKLWKIFCAHQVMASASGELSEDGRIVFFNEAAWQSLVHDLDARTMPVGFVNDESNMDAWLRCENEFADRFESAEFLRSGLNHFSVASVSDPLPVINASYQAPTEIYLNRWKEFVGSLQKAVTLPKAGNTISMRAR
jgi:hypothetical protein